MNLGALRNKRVQLAAAGVGVAAVAGYAVYRRRKSSSSAAAAPADASSSATPGTYVPGSFPDTSGTDMAAYLGQFGSNLQTQLDDFNAQLADELAGVGAIPTAGSTGTGTSAPTGPVGPTIPRSAVPVWYGGAGKPLPLLSRVIPGRKTGVPVSPWK